VSDVGPDATSGAVEPVEASGPVDAPVHHADPPASTLWTLTEAERHANVTRKTLRTMAEGGKLPGAHQDGRGRWLIPAQALGAAGVMARTTPPDAPAVPSGNPAGAPAPVPAAPDPETLRRLAVAEALADERARTIEDLRATVERLSRAMLPAAPGRPAGGRLPGNVTLWVGGAIVTLLAVAALVVALYR
jgi:hypothetical protein